MSFLCWLSALLCWPNVGKNFPFSITSEDCNICLVMLYFNAFSKTWVVFLFSCKHNSLSLEGSSFGNQHQSPDVPKWRLQLLSPTPDFTPVCHPGLSLQRISPSSCLGFHALAGKGNCSSSQMSCYSLPPCVCPSRVLCQECSPLHCLICLIISYSSFTFCSTLD